MKTARFLPILLALTVVSSPAATKTFEDGDKSWTYEVTDIVGWTVYIEVSVAEDKELAKGIREQLEGGFARFVDVVPEERLAFLKSIPVWVSNEPTYPMRANEKGVIPFHRSPRWLRDHGLNPHMAPGVHVINPRGALFENKIFEWGPMTMLHELAHAYHNIKLKLWHKGVKGAYQNAMGNGLYLKVPDRRDPTKKVKAYAATNVEEYFAELTEAYFGNNDWFPHNREELKKYDPKGYAMIEEVWGVSKP